MSYTVIALCALMSVASVTCDTSASFQPSVAPSNYVQQTYPSPAAPQQYPANYGSYSEPSNPGGYSIQTGYEGYLVPAEHNDEGLFPTLGGFLPGRSTLLHFLPKAGLVAGKVGLYLLASTVVLLIGTAFTVGICTFTPICKLTLFGFPFSKETMRGYITPDRLTQATIFVRQAIDKYRDLQKEISQNEKRNMGNKKNSIE